jgi:hypothetical protein
VLAQIDKRLEALAGLDRRLAERLAALKGLRAKL